MVRLHDHPVSCTHKHSGTRLQQRDIKRGMSDTEIHIKFWPQYLKERGCWEDLGLDGIIISKWTINKHSVSVDWIHLAQVKHL